MKTRHIILFLTGLSCLTACQDEFLDRQAPDAIPEEDVFEDPALMQLFVNQLYADVPSFDHDLYDNIADESRSYWGGAPRNVVEGQWFPDNNPMDNWDYSYAAIRKTNMFLSKADGAPVDEETRSELTGQVKFLRAMHYFNLVKRYGGVPLITEPQSLADDLFVERKSLDECFEFIISELTSAIDLLPETYGDVNIDVGKANKYSAKAFLGRVCLFLASPLYNPTGDKSRWEKAALINKEVIDAGIYGLHPDFRTIMLEKNNREEVFSVQFLRPYREHGWDSWAMPDSRSRQDAVR